MGLNFAEIFAHATPADHPRSLPVLLSADTNLVGRCVATARPPVATAKFRVDRTTRKPKQHETDDTQATIEPQWKWSGILARDGLGTVCGLGGGCRPWLGMGRQASLTGAGRA